MGDKVDATDRDFIEKGLADLKKTLEGNDIEMIKTATEHLAEVSNNAFGKAYQQTAQQGQQQGGADYGQQETAYDQQPADDTVVDADYEVVDDQDAK